MSDKGISTDPERISAVKDRPVPHDLKSLRQFLGFKGYYRKFVKNYAPIIQPLNLLLQGHDCNKKSKRKSKNSKTASLWVWGDAQQAAFDSIKAKLISPPVLAYADYALPFIVHTDASALGLGAVLYQKQNGLERVIAYTSHNLRPAEKNYPAHKLDFFGFKVVCYR